MKSLKNLIFIFLISGFTFYSCQKAPSPLTEAEKETISKEVRGTFSQLNAAMNSHNVDEMRKYFSDDQDFIYASTGTVFKNTDDLFKVIASVHSNPELLPFTIEFNDITISVLNQDYVLLTGVGKVDSSIGTDNAKSRQLVMTFLMKRTEGKWLVVVGHESAKVI